MFLNRRPRFRELVADYETSQSSIYVFKSEKYYPYRIQLEYELNEDDSDRRMEFCEKLEARHLQALLFKKNILFTDESAFL